MQQIKKIEKIRKEGSAHILKQGSYGARINDTFMPLQKS